MLKTLLRAAAAVAVLCTAAAAAQTPAPAPGAAGGPVPVTITVASFPDLDRAAQAALARWNALRPDVRVRIVPRNYADHHTAMYTQLATGSGLPDVMAIDFRFIGKFAQSGGFDDLLQPPYNAGPLLPRFVPYTLPQATNTRGQMVALPADIGPGTLLYRQDLLARAGVAEADLIHSWESFIAAGRRLKASTGAYLLADAGDLRDILLRSSLQAGEGLYFHQDGRVLVDSPRFVRAFELGLAVRRAGIDARASAWSNEWAAGLRQGRIAAQIMGSWLAGHLRNWIAPDSSGLWRAAPLPGGTLASYGGSFYAIPRLAPHKAQAWDFIRFLALDRAQQVQALRMLDSFPALAEAHDDPLLDEPIPYLGGQRARQLWRSTAAQVPPVPVNRNDAMATDVIRDEFENVVAQGKDVRQALADARWLIERRARR
ncbi:MAG: extracellular solute-binding protein [Rubrivivax sp.]|nr:extracellular solute-binding protein [Rubrivivax sp.]